MFTLFSLFSGFFWHIDSFQGLELLLDWASEAKVIMFQFERRGCQTMINQMDDVAGRDWTMPAKVTLKFYDECREIDGFDRLEQLFKPQT